MTRALAALAAALILATLHGLNMRDAQYLEQVKAEGARAEHLGTVPGDNPYTQQAERVKWFAGWLESRERRMKDAGLCEP